MNMADAFARVSRSLGVVITSDRNRGRKRPPGRRSRRLPLGSPVLHITTQVDREFGDLDRAAIQRCAATTRYAQSREQALRARA